MDYGFAHQGKVFTPNGTAVEPAENASRNAAMERAELAAWADKPERFAAYAIGNRAQTWTGADLGRIEITATWRRPCRHMGYYTMTAIRVHGSNGAVYVGRYGSDWSQLCHVRRSKREG